MTASEKATLLGRVTAIVRSRGFARVPRELLDGLPGTAWAIATYVLCQGADRPTGYRTTHAATAEVLELSARSVERWMPRLRELGIVDYPRSKTRTHVVRMGPRYWQLLGAQAPVMAEPVAEVMAEPVAEPLSEDAEDVAVVKPPSAKALRPTPGEDVAEPTETETETETETSLRPRARTGWIENLNEYTGCRTVRGTHGFSWRHDVLGKDRPPVDWPYARPTRDEIRAALDAPETGITP